MYLALFVLLVGRSVCQDPGEVIDSTELTDIDDALDSVLLFSAINAVGIGLAFETANDPTYPLHQSEYNTDGSVNHAFAREMLQGQTALNLVEAEGPLVGFEGVMTYNIEETGDSFMIAVSFGVPFNDLLYENRYNVKIYPTTDFITNEGLWQHMQSDKGGQLGPGGYNDGTDYGINWEATMTNGDKAKLIVWLDTTDFDAFGLRTLNSGCETQWGEDHCWRECIYEIGWELTNTECSSDADCTDPYGMVSQGRGCNID